MGATVETAEQAQAEVGDRDGEGFTVELDNFSGPFDVLLGLIGKRKLDITEVALAEVTDEFLEYVAQLRRRGTTALEELSNFLVVAATLLDLKTARLLPTPAGEPELDLELLEARDLLFARLLQYRAYKAVSQVFRATIARTQTAVARSVPLEQRFHALLPPLQVTAGLDDLARAFATALSRDTTPPQVAVDHVHRPLVSVREQRSRLVHTLYETGACEFSELIARPVANLTIVARFLALLEIFKARLCTLDQPEPLGALYIAPTERLLTAGPEAALAAFALDEAGAPADE